MRMFFDDACRLRQSYWLIRSSRRGSDVRKYYRHAVKSVETLLSLGYDDELIRLYRLALANPSSEAREERFAMRYESIYSHPYPYRRKDF